MNAWQIVSIALSAIAIGINCFMLGYSQRGIVEAKRREAQQKQPTRKD